MADSPAPNRDLPLDQPNSQRFVPAAPVPAQPVVTTPGTAALPVAPGSPATPPGQAPAEPLPAQPVAKTPDTAALPVASGSPATRPGQAPADSPAQAAVRATRVADAVATTAGPRPMTTDDIMPTCMIYAMFAGLAILAGTAFCWMGNAIVTALHLFH